MSNMIRPLHRGLGALALLTVIVGSSSLVGCSSTPAVEPGDAGDAAIDPTCGRLTTPCPEGGRCEGAPDCASALCRDGLCQSVNPADGVKNGDETDVDCGGTHSPACADGKGCALAADCTNGVCSAGVCQPPNDHDGVKNGDETGVDCGGPTTPKKCATGQGCAADADCNKVLCDQATKKCAGPSPTDGFKNGDETDVDCGGATAPNRCAEGKGCLATSDCDKAKCDVGATNKCLPPANNDNIKNGSETDIDCGGGPAGVTAAPKCGTGLSCAIHADCQSDGCAYNNKCAEHPSCATQYGGDTCGAGEVGQAGKVHESCCKSLTIPGGTAKVDKYEITAGRMREFITRVGGDVQAWVTANRGITAQIPDAMVQYLPSDNQNPVKSVTQCQPNGTGCVATNVRFGLYGQLGNEVFMPDRPCANCGQGCWVGSMVGQNGHPTYYWDNATQSAQWSAASRINTQAQLDAKSLNCVTQILLAAFCAWDGGRLPTQPELGGTAGAWGAAGMPWGGALTSYRDTVNGAADANRISYPFAQQLTTCPGGNTCFAVPMFLAGGGGTYNPNAATLNWTNFNPFPSSPGVFSARYVFPTPADSTAVDQAYAVASPGRMRKDFRMVGPGADDGYYDIAANLIEMTATSTGTDNANHNSWPTVSWVGGSFEGHTPENRAGYNLSVLTKYGKAGGRCARD